MKTALVVDDSRLARLALTRALEKHGLHVEQVGSAAEAFEFLRGRRPDVVFMDVTMPEMDGFTAAGLITRDPQFAGLPVVMCSAEETDDVRTRTAAAGAMAFLGKTAGDAGLSDILNRLVPEAASMPAAAPALAAAGPSAAELAAQIESSVAAAVASRLVATEAALRQAIEAAVANAAREAVQSMAPALVQDLVYAAVPEAVRSEVGDRLPLVQSAARDAALAVAEDAAGASAGRVRDLAASIVEERIAQGRNEWLHSLDASIESGPLAARIGQMARDAAQQGARSAAESLFAQVREGLMSELRGELGTLRGRVGDAPTREQLDEALAAAHKAEAHAEATARQMRIGMVLLGLGIVASVAIGVLL